LNGIDKVRKLRFYASSKNDENNNEIRESAKVVWELLINGPLLMARRRHVFAKRAKLLHTNTSQRCGSSLIQKVPFHTDFRRYHILLRPKPFASPSFMMHDRSRPTNPKDIPYIGLDVREMEIIRMTLTSPGDALGNTTHHKQSGELLRLDVHDHLSTFVTNDSVDKLMTTSGHSQGERSGQKSNTSLRRGSDGAGPVAGRSTEQGNVGVISQDKGQARPQVSDMLFVGLNDTATSHPNLSS
jgi:hypothetical protein